MDRPLVNPGRDRRSWLYSAGKESTMFTSRTFASALARVAAAVGIAQAAGACDVFDPSLFQMRMAVTLSDRCERDVPLIASSETRFFIDTAGMAGDYHDFTGCARRDLPGNDGFVKINTEAGEKWHVHVEPLEASLDPAIYLLPSCDVRTCETRAANDACGAGRAEHLSFISRGGSYFVGVDSRLAGGGPFSIIVTRPICGNGEREHSESCDDGNTLSGDNCDSSCRSELFGASVTEKESNEMPQEANVLTSAPMTINGKIGDHCGDVDVFAVAVAEGGAIQAQLLSRTGNCASAPTRLALIGPDGQTELGSVSSLGDVCPAIGAMQPFARALPAGTYYVHASSLAADAFDYQLKLERR
jgi:cysteine-rich repeat protein